MKIPQLILYLQSGTLRAEVPGLNGARRKLDLIPGEVESQLRSALLDEEQRFRDAERQASRELQRANILRALAAGQQQGRLLVEPSALLRGELMSESWTRKIWGDKPVSDALGARKLRTLRSDSGAKIELYAAEGGGVAVAVDGDLLRNRGALVAFVNESAALTAVGAPNAKPSRNTSPNPRREPNLRREPNFELIEELTP